MLTQTNQLVPSLGFLNLGRAQWLRKERWKQIFFFFLDDDDIQTLGYSMSWSPNTCDMSLSEIEHPYKKLTRSPKLVQGGLHYLQPKES